MHTHNSIMNPSSRVFIRGLDMELAGVLITDTDESRRPSTKRTIAKSLVSLQLSEIFRS